MGVVAAGHIFGAAVVFAIAARPHAVGIVTMFADVERSRGTAVEEQRERIASRIPLGFIPTDADCAGAVVFFASDLARAISGQCLDVNGGEVFD